MDKDCTEQEALELAFSHAVERNDQEDNDEHNEEESTDVGDSVSVCIS